MSVILNSSISFVANGTQDFHNNSKCHLVLPKSVLLEIKVMKGFSVSVGENMSTCLIFASRLNKMLVS